MARSTWDGALIFAGFPIPVKAYPLVSSTSPSFKTLCDCHDLPIKQEITCATTGKNVTGVKKGHEHAKGAFTVVDSAAIDALAGPKTTGLEIERVCPLDTLDLYAAKASYSFIPEPNKGAEKPVAILWRTLKKLNAAAVTRWTPRQGQDQTLALHAGAKGLIGTALAMPHQLSGATIFAACDVTVADAEVAMFENALTGMYPNADYVAADFPSAYQAKRQAAIDAAIAGKPLDAPAAAAAAPAVPDLMAALSASLAAVTPKEEPIAA